jgi:hypothetical protein
VVVKPLCSPLKARGISLRFLVVVLVVARER